MTATERRSRIIRQVCSRFEAEFGGSRPRVFFAPGRVNLIGAHLDYNGGDVLPMALDRGVYVAARLSGDDLVRLRSLDQELTVDVPTQAVPTGPSSRSRQPLRPR